MPTRTRLNLYFDRALMPQIESLALRRKVSKSAVVEAAVMSYLSSDSADRLEAAMSRRLDRFGRQIDAVDLDLAVPGETLGQFIHFWMTITPPHPGGAQSGARAKWGRSGSRVSCRPSAGAWRPAPQGAVPGHRASVGRQSGRFFRSAVIVGIGASLPTIQKARHEVGDAIR